MKPICEVVICSMLAMPGLAQAEPEFNGEALIGHGNSSGDEEAYGILTLNVADKHELESGTKINWNFRARVRSDESSIGETDNDIFDTSVDFDFGAGGKLGFSAYDDIGQLPWADGELYNRGSVGVFPAIRKRFDNVADTQFNLSRVKIDPDLLVTYSNKVSRVKLDFVANPFGTWDGNDDSEILGTAPVIEGKASMRTDYGIYSVAYNDLDDVELKVVYPMPKKGLTVIGGHSIEEGDWGDSRASLAAIYRTKDFGAFKGFMLAHARDDADDRTMLNLNFGGKGWEAKLAGDSDSDLAIEGSYNITENSTIKFGWDNGHELKEGFNDLSFPAPVFAPARDSAFEIAYVLKLF